MRDVPVTLKRVLRAMVGRMLRAEMTQQDVAHLFGADRTHISKYLRKDTDETRELTLAHLDAYAEKLPGGVHGLIAELNSIAATMPANALTEDECFYGDQKRGRPPKKAPPRIQITPDGAKVATVSAMKLQAGVARPAQPVVKPSAAPASESISRPPGRQRRL